MDLDNKGELRKRGDCGSFNKFPEPLMASRCSLRSEFSDRLLYSTEVRKGAVFVCSRLKCSLTVNKKGGWI